MATNVPPHNLVEIIAGCKLLLRNKETSIDDLIKHIPAPDFPTGGIIYGRAGVVQGYKTGRGRVVIRAKTQFEETGRIKGKNAIIVEEIPFQVNKENILKTIMQTYL